MLQILKYLGHMKVILGDQAWQLLNNFLYESWRDHMSYGQGSHDTNTQL